TQGGEPNDDPNAATTIQPDTLVVGHTGSSGDQEFYNVKLDGLPPGSKVDVFLQVPEKTDLDLTISKPAAPSFFSSPVGATPVGATPIEDRGVGFGGTGWLCRPRRCKTYRWERPRSAPRPSARRPLEARRRTGATRTRRQEGSGRRPRTATRRSA